TGDELWRETHQWVSKVGDREMKLGFARGSLLKVDGDFLCLGEFGHLSWLRMDSKGCEVLDRALPFVAQQTWSPLVLSRGLLYVCQNTRAFDSDAKPRILCFDLRAAQQ
ncbi:MAG: outer membrane protein assembly factor BamB, partial [Rhodothermales bacterium]